MYDCTTPIMTLLTDIHSLNVEKKDDDDDNDDDNKKYTILRDDE